MEAYHHLARDSVIAFVVIFFFAPHQSTVPPLMLQVGAVVMSVYIVLICVYDPAGRIYRRRQQRALIGPQERVKR